MDAMKKDFDCVEMKNQIQQKLQKEWEGLTFEQIQERIHRHLSTSDDKLAQWWRRANAQAAARQKAMEAADREFEELSSESHKALLK